MNGVGAIVHFLSTKSAVVFVPVLCYAEYVLLDMLLDLPHDQWSGMCKTLYGVLIKSLGLILDIAFSINVIIPVQTVP